MIRRLSFLNPSCRSVGRLREHPCPVHIDDILILIRHNDIYNFRPLLFNYGHISTSRLSMSLVFLNPKNKKKDAKIGTRTGSEAQMDGGLPRRSHNRIKGVPRRSVVGKNIWQVCMKETTSSGLSNVYCMSSLSVVYTYQPLYT